MKIKIELNVLLFMAVFKQLHEHDFLLFTNQRPVKDFDQELFKEAFIEVCKQFGEQFTDDMADEFERKHIAKKLLFENNN